MLKILGCLRPPAVSHLKMMQAPTAATPDTTSQLHPVPASVIDRLCNFFIVVTHIILHIHTVYPHRKYHRHTCCTPIAITLYSSKEWTNLTDRTINSNDTGLFSLRNKDGICVYMCRHPDVRTYITEIVTSMRPWLQQVKLRLFTFII